MVNFPIICMILAVSILGAFSQTMLQKYLRVRRRNNAKRMVKDYRKMIADGKVLLRLLQTSSVGMDKKKGHIGSQSLYSYTQSFSVIMARCEMLAKNADAFLEEDNYELFLKEESKMREQIIYIKGYISKIKIVIEEIDDFKKKINK